MISAAYFFFLLCGYYIIRPIREEMGVLGGVENLQWLFSGTLIAMLSLLPLFGWITSRLPRRRFLPWVYGFFILHLLLFFGLLKTGYAGPWLAWAFFIWTSVFNLFVVSVFWSFMADIFREEQAKRLFPCIAAGGTLGAIAGPLITTSLVQLIGTADLLFLSALLLLGALLCIRRLAAMQRIVPAQTAEIPMGGGAFEGLWLILGSRYLMGICLLILCYSTLGTFLYFQQAEIIRDSFIDSAKRTAMFSSIDLAVNILTLLLQTVLTGRIIKWLGLAGTLAAIPLLLAAGFAALGHWPLLAVLLTLQIVRRAGDYAVMRPTREMLFVILSRPEKYKAKNFIDTSVCRAGDTLSAWGYAGLGALGLSLTQIAWLAVPIALFWALIGYRLGIQHHGLALSARGSARDYAT